MSKKMLIDARHPEETRVALLSGNKVEDFDFESLSRKPLRGNIYLARITRVEPSLQAAFVEYGGNRHGFLAFGEIHPDYYQIPVADREALLAAEALEAELAAKLSELDDEGVDIDDDDDHHADTQADDEQDSEDSEPQAIADEKDDESSPPKRGRGRRRRGRRGRRGQGNSSEGDNETSTDEADPEKTEEKNDAAEITASDEVTQQADSEKTAQDADSEVQPAEDTSWHGTDEEVLTDIHAAEDSDSPVAEDASAAPESDETSEKIEEKDEDDEEDTPPVKPIALSAKVSPQLTEELPASSEPSEDDDAAAKAEDVKAEASSEDLATSSAEDVTTENAPETDETADSLSAESSEISAGGDDTDETSEAGDEPETEAETEAPGEPTEEELEAKRRAEEIADLQRRYDEARRNRDRIIRNYRIQEVIKRRQIMLVQVVKEERGNKGAALTTYLSLAGRYGVLMPNNSRGGGVSRKISNQSDRKRLRKAISELEVPKGQGLIIRTAGAKRTKAEIKRDYDYLARLWDTIRDHTLKSVAPCLIYEEASLIKRAIRDLYDKDTSEILVEGEEGYREAKDFMKMLMPSHAKNVQPYRDPKPSFLRYGVERQLDEMYQPVVNLKSGGYLVIQQTEALISVDVNSGKATKERNVEATALKTNSEAAVELARQCRLRDLAGLIVVDFIDMEENRNNRAVEKKFKEALKTDRARIQVGSISNFGLLEMSRQRRRSGIVDGTTRLCPVCEGAGSVRSVEMAALRVLRAIEEKAVSDRAGHVEATTSDDVALYILNQKRSWLNRIEESYGVTIEIIVSRDLTGDQLELQTSGKARDTDSLRQSGGVEIGEVTVSAENEDDEDEASSAKNDAEAATSDDDNSEDDENRPKRRRRRKRRRKSEDSSEENSSSSDDASLPTDEMEESVQSEDKATVEAQSDDSNDEEDASCQPRKGRRRGRRRKPEEKTENSDLTAESHSSDTPSDSHDEGETKNSSAPETETREDTVSQSGADASTDDADDTAQASEDTETQAKTAASIHAPLPETDKKPEKPKRGGWWQRTFGRNE